MEVLRVLHMNGGSGKTSYANNSLMQRNVIRMTKPITEEAITEMYSNIASTKSICIADLGCSSGPNTFLAIKEIVRFIDELRQKHGHAYSPEFTLHLNDLPGTDFNSIFRVLLHDFKDELKHEMGLLPLKCFVNGVPGSFYGRLFAAETLHFVHSSYSLHWLSKVPDGLETNRENISMTSTSPKDVIRAYYGQFQSDFSMFLKCRAEELVNGGKMVLTVAGRKNDDASSKECGHTHNAWEPMALALREMVYEGLIEEEKLHSFNVPLYTPSPKEVEVEVIKEGSFCINRLETSEVKLWAACGKCGFDDDDDDDDDGYNVAQCMRSVSEPLLVVHFGHSIIEKLFEKYKNILCDSMSKGDNSIINVTVSITKREYTIKH